jgi:hypothetical protein
MTDYYMGLAVGGMIGYCLALITLITMWGLCVVAHNSKGQECDENNSDTEKK